MMMNRELGVYTCTDFRGFWPVGTAAVVVAFDEIDAAIYLEIELGKIGISQGIRPEQMHKLKMEERTIEVLADGNY